MINGVAAVPIMAMIMLMASRKAVMGQFTLTKWLTVLDGSRRRSWRLRRSACLRPGEVKRARDVSERTYRKL